MQQRRLIKQELQQAVPPFGRSIESRIQHPDLTDICLVEDFEFCRQPLRRQGAYAGHPLGVIAEAAGKGAATGHFP